MSDVRRANRSSLLTDLFHGGRQSRRELGATTALSQASVSNLIGEMIGEGLVEEAGQVGSDGGRPRVMLQVRPGFRYVAGADVGETKVRVELYDLAMNRLAAAGYEHDDDPSRVASLLVRGLEKVLGDAGVTEGQLLGYGVGVPGVVDQGVVYAQTVGWDAVPLARLIGTEVPVFVENGARAVGQAEMWFGAGRGARHAIIVLIGTGVGAAVITDGHGYRGGEWGHTTLVYDGDPCRCGARGCLEAYVGGDRIVARVAAALGVEPEPGLLDRALAAGSAPEVFADVAGYLGAGIADLINLFSPERIVIGGRTGLPLAEHLLPAIRDAAAGRALHRPFSQTVIGACELGPDAVALGAATLPIARLLAVGGLPDQSVRAE